MPADDPLVVNNAVAIPRTELTVRATRAGGPGGQHVNTSSTRVELTWKVARSGVLDDAQKARVRSVLASRLDTDGTLRIAASDTRSQRQNRELAEQRLAALVRRALIVPRTRRKTKPTRAAVERRLTDKKLAGAKKRDRRYRTDD
ncbi:MAG: aminoacyl-tRNA hydrolase [Gemmatimonadaceae bacterium]|nr:aminoacyl-tRNA hydrolase [Gemmatimonadaceae bacterium]